MGRHQKKQTVQLDRLTLIELSSTWRAAPAAAAPWMSLELQRHLVVLAPE